MTDRHPEDEPTVTRSDSSATLESLHGRFDPGARLGTRYRVVGLLGRGGMGEVYRADDLELNQQVALKFLPERLARSPADLARLRREVRIARQIAHPNVCRTYDLAEAGGQYFVVMEYVDGENLASALRRLGRPAPHKALEIARQLCLGLGAAHENGILHRDLKPANIMIDGKGRVRITDFGLAGTAEEIAAESDTAGTPGYMAPEHLASGGGSVPGDIYSLGLVLHELFTGRTAREVGSEAQARAPSSQVPDADPDIERLILRCLEVDPRLRPQSAYAVLVALPGGDPLAAAVAAGETPSPELVATAGDAGTVSPPIAAAGVVAVLLALAAVSFLQRPLYEGLGVPANLLTWRADQILAQATGQTTPRYSIRNYRYAPEPGTGKQFWRRWSPLPILSPDIHAQPSIADPPQAYPGSATAVLGPDGRLLGLSIVPTASDSARPSSQGVNWEPLLRAAGRDPARVLPVTPPTDFLAPADTTAAWSVSAAPAPDTVLVAAALRGRTVAMETRVGGRAISRVDVAASEPPIRALEAAGFLLISIPTFFGSILLASRNLKRGRGDIRGAIVVGISVVLLYPPLYLLSVDLGEAGFIRTVSALMNGTPAGHALIHGFSMAVAYLAVEPYVRRLWPNILVSWARLVAGRWRDPIVGRDILAGAVGGTVAVLGLQSYQYLARNAGIIRQPLQISPRGFTPLIEWKGVLGFLSVMGAVAMVRALTFFTMLVILRYLFRNSRAAVIGVSAIFFLFLWSGVETGLKPTLLLVPFALTFAGVAVFIAMRFGFLAAVSIYLFAQILTGLPWTSDWSSWFAPQVILSWAIVVVLLGFASLTAVGGKLLDPLGDHTAR